MDPQGKVAPVSGGNSGLGQGAVERLLAAGATVVLLDLALLKRTSFPSAPGGRRSLAKWSSSLSARR